MPGPEQRNRGIEAASAILLSVAAVASSWGSYQAGLWDGEQAAQYSRANALRIESSRVALKGDALAQVEIQAFNAWLNAKVRGEEGLAGFYEARFPPHLKSAFRSWLRDRPLTEPSAPPTPFAADGYQRPGMLQAQELERRAEATFQRGQYANGVSDGFQQAVTLLAIALFFGGIGQVFEGRGARIAMLAVGGVAAVLGLLRMVSLPLQILGLGVPV